MSLSCRSPFPFSRIVIAGTLVAGTLFGAQDSRGAAEEAESPAGVREIDVPELAKFGKPAYPRGPLVIQTRDELAKIITDEAIVEAILKEVPLGQEWLAFFRWSGSGQDRVTAAITKGEDGKGSVAFAYQPGRTKDLRQHAKLFAVKKSVATPPVAEDAAAQANVSDDVAKVREGLATWAKAKEQCGGNYSYTIRFSSFTGFGHVTTIVVRSNKVAERRFEKFSGPPQPIAPGDAPPRNEGWTESTEDLGSHKAEGAPVLTLDEIYAAAEKIASTTLPEHERRYVRTDKQGLLTSCFTIDTRIADDAPTKGIVISSITLEKP